MLNLKTKMRTAKEAYQPAVWLIVALLCAPVAATSSAWQTAVPSALASNINTLRTRKLTVATASPSVSKKPDPLAGYATAGGRRCTDVDYADSALLKAGDGDSSAKSLNCDAIKATDCCFQTALSVPGKISKEVRFVDLWWCRSSFCGRCDVRCL